jgi:hypothetical protein
MNRYRLGFIVLSLPILALGCQKQAKSQMPPLHSVQGIVTKDGKPIKEAFVQFVPESGSENVTINALTNAEGKFELATLYVQGAVNEKKPGAPEGKYTVNITMPLDAQQRGGEQYQLPDKFQVKPGANDFPLEVNLKKK